MPEIIKSFSVEKREEIANKKYNTFYSKSIEERDKINKSKNIWLNLNEKEKDELRKRISIALYKKSHIISKKAKELNLSFTKRVLQMSAITFGVALISFGIGYLVKYYFGIEI